MIKKNLLWIFTLLFWIHHSCTSKQESKQRVNHLANETSAYLLEHAQNPVDWYPWGDEALKKAEKESKLLIISIGYSSCHWCHVMERETFSDTAVSRLMNEHFVSIKVDREERPDIDNVYMTACQIASQSGNCGWPLNAITLSDGKPVWVGSYLAREDWMKLLKRIGEVYSDNPNELQRIAYQIANHLSVDHKFDKASANKSFDLQTLKNLHPKIAEVLDYVNGGKSGEIKFPMPSLIEYVLEYAHFVKDTQAASWVKITLDRMMNGGIYDQLAGGFARYSTDPLWKVPHFEKMLYDNAQLISIYSKAYKWNKSTAYKELLEQTLDFMQTDFSDGMGHYYSSFDADSEKEEGKYYIWTQQELKSLLDEKSFNLVSDYYGITANGNWEHGKNILHVVNPLPELIRKFQSNETELISLIEQSKEKLLLARKSKIAPHRDEKVIASWNAMMVSALADAYSALGNSEYLEQAIKAGNFLRNELISQDLKMYRTYQSGKKGQYAFLDDYAFTIQAFIKLYEVTFDEAWLQLSKKLCDKVISDFSDEEKIYFYYNSSQDPGLIARKKEIDDQVIPSSNSVMCDVLHRLGSYYYNAEYQERSQKMLNDIIANPAVKYASFHSNWIRQYMSFVKPYYEVAIVGPEFGKLHKDLLSRYLPQVLFLGGATEGSLELLKEKLQGDQTFIYVCRNKVCKLPVKEVAKAIELIK